MGAPHPALLALAAGRPLPAVSDLDRLAASAVEHHMTGLLWSRVRSGETDGPTPWKETLARRDVVTRSRHERLWTALPGLTSKLADLDVEVALLKGVAAERRWYDRAGERPCVDLDLLVHPGQVDRVDEIVTALQPDHPLRASSADLFRRGLAQSVDLDVDGVRVDLHLDVFKLGPNARHPDRLWEHTMPFVAPDGTPLRVPDPELSLVHFLVHLNKDSYCWLLGFADVAHILEREDLDWGAVDRLVADEKLGVPVWAGLAAVVDTLGITGPARTAEGWRSRLWQVLWPAPVRLQGDLGWIRHRHRMAWLPLLSGASLGEALKWARIRLASSPEVVAYSSPARRGPWRWRLVRGRIDRIRARRRAIARLRRRDR